MKVRTLLVLACLMISAASVGVAAEDPMDIPATAESTGDHTSLVAALAHADLVGALQGEGPFTVFAPTDAAFTALLADLGITAVDELGHPLALECFRLANIKPDTFAVCATINH